MSDFTITVPPEFVEQIARRVAELVGENGQHEPYLDVAGAAEYLAAPKSRVYELVESERVRVHRDGRRLLFRREDLDAALLPGE